MSSKALNAIVICGVISTWKETRSGQEIGDQHSDGMKNNHYNRLKIPRINVSKLYTVNITIGQLTVTITIEGTDVDPPTMFMKSHDGLNRNWGPGCSCQDDVSESIALWKVTSTHWSDEQSTFRSLPSEKAHFSQELCHCGTLGFKILFRGTLLLFSNCEEDYHVLSFRLKAHRACQMIVIPAISWHSDRDSLFPKHDFLRVRNRKSYILLGEDWVEKNPPGMGQ
jgi:hypothetical protein